MPYKDWSEADDGWNLFKVKLEKMTPRQKERLYGKKIDISLDDSSESEGNYQSPDKLGYFCFLISLIY